MQCRFSFKHMKTSQALSDYAQSKILQKISKFSTKPIEAHVTFEVGGHLHNAHCSVKGGDGFNVEAEASSEDMYASVDMLVAKIEGQLKRQKERLKKHKFATNLKSLPMQPQDTAEDCDSVPVDADDLIKYEKARLRASG